MKFLKKTFAIFSPLVFNENNNDSPKFVSPEELDEREKNNRRIKKT